jgi:maltooligosyltrehalose trehalohydrolase
MPFGTQIRSDGVTFALWAPSAREVALVCDESELAMPQVGHGWYRLAVPAAHAGSRYCFRIDGKLDVPDPASRRQADNVKGRSVVVDPASFEWSDAAWHGRPWEDVVLYEAHVGAATPEGTFAALTERLDAIAATGLTAIELLPLSDCPGTRNWG